ncbi:DUF5337 domain-containing protein [Maritimibacter sp. HL-12]|jgi:threonine/homoserine/homoserine lactone efflux protein|uniref:DUF5337 domain-containing protein n=1 Tax=Maritimibacter sp. HL-12 TaxID=1162418 RepID=UPI000A0F3830|nr:DUF5337 domain-containing protein [Maritimibacter sp. HL-12]SMH29415.1 hypothetical protein SAMN05661107_0089 [Maritimibacter sp. HL-12]
MSTDPDDKALARQGRIAALVAAATGLFWIGAIWAGNEWDWTQRTRALFDLVALAGFAFVLIVTFRIWRARQKNEG